MKKIFTKFLIATTSKFTLGAAALSLVGGFFIFSHSGKIILNEAKEIASENFDADAGELNPDRPDLAIAQDIARTKDPALGYVPRERLANVYNLINQYKAQKKITPMTTASWTERGPSNVGGRTRAIMFDPNDVTNKKMWAGGVGGGLWFTNDITVASPVWTSVNDFWANLAVASIAYDPSNTNNFYVGTGEGWFNIDAIQGAGIWKTTDGGATWNQLASTNNSNFYYVQKIVVASNGNVFAATRTNGVYRSTDGGTTWTKVLGSGTGASTNRAADLEIAADGTIFASMGIFTTDGVYSSATGAAGSWTKLNTGGNGFPTSGFYNIELACAPSNANRVYAMVCNTNYTLLNIYTTTNKGTTWSAVTLPSWYDQSCVSPSTDMTRTQAWYDLILAVDPNNENNVLAGGVDIMKTTNAGSSWTQITSWWGGCARPNVHADQHAIVYSPGSSSTAVFGNDGGFYYSSNVNAGTPAFSNKNTGYNVTQFYACAIHPTAAQNYFLAGAQDNGTQKFTTAGMNATTSATGGDGAYCFIDQTNPSYQITAYVYNVYYRSTNGGASFSNIINDQSSGDFINPADYDDANGILYSSYSTTQLKRTSGIRGVPSQTQITITGMSALAGCIRVSPYAPAGTTTLFVGTQNGRLYKVTNAQGGSPTSTSIGGGSFPSGTISCVEIGASELDLVVTFSNYGVSHVWRTTNGGSTWTNESGNLPDMPVRWAIYNPNDLKELFLATEVGVWSTTDVTAASPAYVPNNTGLANVRCDMFQMRNSDKELIVATHGRGLFSSSVFNAAPPVADFIGNPTTICVGQNVTFTDQSTNAPTSWSWTFNGGTPATSTLQNPVVTYNTAGTYFVTLTATNASGSDTKTKLSYITVNALPSVSISTAPSATICSGNNVTLTASGANTYLWSSGQTTTSITVAPTSNTTYTVTGTNASGCTAIATQAITVSTPTVTTSVSPSSTICLGNSATITASGASTYSWSPGGQTTASIAVSPTVNTTYTVIGTNAIGCTASATRLITVSSPAVSIAASPSATICIGNSTTLTASGASTYSWNTGATTAAITVSPTSNTTYTVTGTNALGCTNTATKAVTVNALPTVSISVTPSATICSGSNATLTASGASTYSWSTGQTTVSITVSPTTNTTYTVTGTNASGCTNTSTKSITVNSLSVSMSMTSETCAGNDGTATATPTGSVPYTYSWNPGGQNTQTATGLAAGNYSCTVTDGNGCVKTGTITVTNSCTVPVADFNGSPTTICAGSNVTFTDASTNSPTSWSWVFQGGTPATSTLQNPVVTYNTAGTYSVSLTATNMSGSNTKTKLNYITVNAIPSVSVAVNPSATICSGTSVTMTASGATTYSWAPGGQTTAGKTVAPTTTTTYTVTGTSLGCSSSQTQIITVNPLPTTTITAAPSTTICKGASATLTASGASSYLWSSGQTTTSIIVGPTVNTTYTVTGTGANGCTKTATKAITVTSPTVTISTSPSATICNGTSATLTASGASTYAWSTGQTGASIAVSPTANTTYSVTGTSAGGCTSTTSQLITISSATVTISTSPSATVCSGDAITLTASGASVYSWSPGGQTTSTITDVVPSTTTYSVFGTNGNGCTNSATQVITVNPAPSPTITVTPSATICSGSSVTLTASGASTYSWSPGGQTTANITVNPTTNTTYTLTASNGCATTTTQAIMVNALPTTTITASPSATICIGSSATLTASGANTYVWNGGQTTTSITVSPTVNTTYTVIGTNASGCTKSSTKTLVVSNPNVTISVSPSATICNGSNVTLTASGGSTYSWNTGATTASIVTSPTSNTTYTVTGTNAIGCSKTATRTITVSSVTVNISASPSSTVCIGDAITLTASGASTYSWSGGQTTASITDVVSATTTYTVTGTSATGCTKTSMQTISVTTAPSTTITVTPSATICSGSSVTLAASGAMTYSWSPGGQTTSSVTASPTTSTTYTLTGSNGCASTNTQAITVNPLPSTVITVSPSSTICSGGSVTLTASGANTYLWSSGQTTSSITVSPASNTTYTVTGTSASGCSAKATQLITVSTLNVTVSASPSATICSGTTITLTASGAASYSWSTGATTASIVDSPTANTTYTVTGTNSSGCTKTTTKAVVVSSPTVNVSVSPSTTICTGGTITLTASGVSTYSWSGGQTTASISDAPSSTTVYSVTGTSAIGCTQSASATVTVVSPPVVVIMAGDTTICSGTADTLTASGASTYSWSTGQTTASIVVAPTASTTYTVTGTQFCASTATQAINVNPLPSVSLSLNPDTVCISVGPYALTGGMPSGGTYSGTGVSAGNFDPSSAGGGLHTITYTFTDSLGCSNSDSMQIYVDLCTGVQTLFTLEGITVYPNPNSGIFTIQSKEANGEVTITNVLGEKVYSSLEQLNNLTVNISARADGIYFLRIKTAHGTGTMKIILSR
ncbi:MAG: PKD domain-containing protein [Bacteroidetes bacterium]|nr:PKD domain-containing protein [Bacteroidota bacterium]